MGNAFSDDIKSRAEKLKEAAVSSQKNAKSIYEETNLNLRESIKKTSAINEIKQLSQTILAITSQTNLLALNASIEAARAGRGFAVVAIMGLSRAATEGAEGSSQIAQKISDIAIQTNDIVSLSTESRNSAEMMDESMGFFRIQQKV